jgi:hypothetical protein
MQPAKKPTDSDRNYCSRVGLRLDRPPQPLVERTGGVSRGVHGLAEQVLTGADCLVHLTLGLRGGVAREAADLLLHFAANVADCAFDSIFVHIRHPPAALWSRFRERSCGRSKTVINRVMTTQTLSKQILPKSDL